jgi:RND superfamily putative drug exporter
MVALFGRANWWLPAWAARLLRVPDPAAAIAPPSAAAPPTPLPARFAE